MSVKLIRRGSVLKNTVLFIFLSFIFYHITQALFVQVSVVEPSFLIEQVLDSKLMIALGLISLIQVWRARRSSLLFMTLFFCHVFLEGFMLFLADFDKVLLLLSFVYLIFAFYYLIFWKLELEDAIYHPHFSLNDIRLRPRYPIDIEIKLEGGKSYTGFLSNWGESSCFVLLDEKWDEIRGHLKLKIMFEGHEFESFAQVVSVYGPGVGLKFTPQKESNSAALEWRHFYDIIDDRGYAQNIL